MISLFICPEDESEKLNHEVVIVQEKTGQIDKTQVLSAIAS